MYKVLIVGDFLQVYVSGVFLRFLDKEGDVTSVCRDSTQAGYSGPDCLAEDEPGLISGSLQQMSILMAFGTERALRPSFDTELYYWLIP